MSDSHKVFQCPNCQQYVSTRYDICRFCSQPLTDEIKSQAINKEIEDSRQYRFKNHKKVFYTGIGVAGVGTCLLLVSIASVLFTPDGRVFLWSPIIILIGLGLILSGFIGMGEERKKKNKNV